MKPLRTVSLQIGFELQFSAGVLGAHVADLAENRSGGTPGPVIAAQYPENSGVSIGIAAIQGIGIVQANHGLQRLLGAGRPFQDLFSPKHPQIIVHPAFTNQLNLRGIPQGVMGFGILKGFG